MIETTLHIKYYSIFTPLYGSELDNPDDIGNPEMFQYRGSTYAIKEEEIFCKLVPDDIVYVWDEETFYIYEPPYLVEPLKGTKTAKDLIIKIINHVNWVQTHKAEVMIEQAQRELEEYKKK